MPQLNDSPYEQEEYLRMTLSTDKKKLLKINPRFNKFSFEMLCQRIERTEKALKRIKETI